MKLWLIDNGTEAALVVARHETNAFQVVDDFITIVGATIVEIDLDDVRVESLVVIGDIWGPKEFLRKRVSTSEHTQE